MINYFSNLITYFKGDYMVEETVKSELKNLFEELLKCINRLEYVPYWSKAGRTRGGRFKVLGRRGDYVLVEPENGDTQNIPLKDFLMVLNLWKDYIRGVVKRHELRDKTRFSSYIISILHICLGET